MPSTSRASYYSRYKKDVTALKNEIETNERKNGGKQGKRAHGHLGRSAVVMLCSALESYIENVMKEVIEEYYIENIKDANALPDSVQSKLCELIPTKTPNELFRITGDGWKGVYLDLFNKNVFSDYGFSSPHVEKINMWMNDYIGIRPLIHFKDNALLNKFVKLRGKIAHGGIEAGYIGKHDVDNHIHLVDRVVFHIDEEICLHLKEFLYIPKQPWKNTSVD